MKLATGTFAALLMLAAPALAQAPGPPAGSTGLCKDGTYSSSKLKLGACHGHKGVKTWFGAPPVAAPSAPAAAAPAMSRSSRPMGQKSPPTSPAAAGGVGGAGQVWVNTRSKVYHCQSDPYYGKTKQGQYMTEAAAIAAGDHADHGKACH